MLCPLCAYTLAPGEPACPSCNAWLAEYQKMVYTVNALFNEGVRLMQAMKYAKACQKFAMAAAYRPDDVEVLSLYAICAECSGNRLLAMDLYGELATMPERHEPGDLDALLRLQKSTGLRKPAYLDAVEALQQQGSENMRRALNELALFSDNPQ